MQLLAIADLEPRARKPEVGTWEFAQPDDVAIELLRAIQIADAQAHVLQKEHWRLLTGRW